MSIMITSSHRTGPRRGLLAAFGFRLGILWAAAALGACSASDLADTAAHLGIAAARGACHAAGNCGVSCPAGEALNDTTLACAPAPP